jgi:large subunit ribosomal protein L24
MKSTKPRKQRKKLYNAPLHKKRKWIAAHLAENLLLKYDRRSIPIVKGDTVKVMRGIYRGHEEKVANVDVHRQMVEVEGITTIKADGTKVARPIHPSNLLVTKLNLTDIWRRKKLEKGLPEEIKREIEEEAQEQIKELEEEKAPELPLVEEEKPVELEEKPEVKEEGVKPEKVKAEPPSAEEKPVEVKEKPGVKEEGVEPEKEPEVERPKAEKKPVKKKVTSPSKKKTVKKSRVKNEEEGETEVEG